MDKLLSQLERGEENEAPGLMEQWLRENKLSEEQIISEAVGTFAAGVDTVCLSSYIQLMRGYNAYLIQTANQSVFLLHAMAKYPEVQERLYLELKSVLGDSRYVTSEHLQQLPYLKGCMLESFR